MNALMKLVLKGSVLAIIATGVATGCGTDKDDSGTGGEAGEPTNGGSNSTAGTKNEGGGGADSAGGSSEGGTSVGGSAVGGEATVGGDTSGGTAQGGAAQGGASGTAVGKFCNGIVLSTDEDGEGGAGPVDNDTTFRVELGTGDDVVTFVAKTGECAPADGAACTAIPVGDVPYKLFDDDTDTELDSGTVPMVEDGEEWFFWSEIFEGFPVLSGGTQSTLECSEATYEDVLPPL